MTVKIGERKPKRKTQSKAILKAESIQNSLRPAAPLAAPNIKTAISKVVSLTIRGPTLSTER